ncbi:MAG: IS21 family transposase [Deferribacterales bacterium]
MRKIRDVLRLKHSGMSDRQIAKSLGISRDAVKDYSMRAKAAGLSYPLPADVDDYELETRLFPSKQSKRDNDKPKPDFAYIHKEMMRRGSTLEALHNEFLAAQPNGISYKYMCELYRNYRSKLSVTMRKSYKAGEVVFVDYSGMTQKIYDKSTNTYRTAQIFVGVMGASNYTYAEATWSQKIPDWIKAHVNMFEYFGGVPEVVTPDNLKSAVIKASRGEPDLQETYRDMAAHYETAVIPTRAGKPKDKAKAEYGVLLVQRWILFRLRDRIFTSLAELNETLREMLTELNAKPFKKMNGSRQSLFDSIDKPALMKLPAQKYEYVKFLKVRAGADYHVGYESNHYSVPHQIAKEEVELRVTSNTIEILFKGRRVASHALSDKTGDRLTQKEHMPAAHNGYVNWEPMNDLEFAKTIGANTYKFLKYVFEKSRNHDAKYRQSITFKRLIKSYDYEVIEDAAQTALGLDLCHTVGALDKLIKSKAYAVATEDEELIEANFEHENIRGASYYK